MPCWVLGVVSVIICLKMDDFFTLRAARCCIFPACSSAQCLSDGTQGHWMEAWMLYLDSLSLWDARAAGAFLVHHWQCGKPAVTPLPHRRNQIEQNLSRSHHKDFYRALQK